MDKFELAKHIKNTRVIEKVSFIQNLCRGKTVLDLGCIRHSAKFATTDPNWLHNKIREVAHCVIGIDYLQDEVKQLNGRGYDIRYGDVTKPLPLDEKFEVIVAGDLIEHLSNFDGFFENCMKLLKNDGILIISTPNPFYIDEFHYVSLKQIYLINPEHTCWIDPQALLQLSQRYHFTLSDIYFIEHSWNLSDLICEKKGCEYDILNSTWNDTSPSGEIGRRYVSILFNIFYIPFKFLFFRNTKLVRYSDYLAILKRDN